MSDDDRVIGNPVQKAMEAVVEAWESALNKIREYKQEYQAQLEELAGMGGMPTRAQALGVLKSFYERVNGLRDTLNQPPVHEVLPQIEAPAMATSAAPVTPMPRKRLTKLVLPKTRVAAPSVSANVEGSEQQATTTESQAESPFESQPGRSATPGPSASCDPQSEDVNNREDKGKDKAIGTSTTTTTTPTKSSSSSKSGSGSIVTKKDIKGKGRAKSNSPSPLPFSAKTLNKITKTVNNRKTSRLPLIKPVSTLKLASVSAATKSVPGPSRSDQRPATPEPELESDSESETEYLSVLEFHRSLSSPPDASSTPGPSLTTAAAATADASNSPTPNDIQEQSIARTDKATSNVEVVDCGPTTTVTEESNSASASGSGSGSNSITFNDIKETHGKGKVSDSDTPTKTTTASGSGSNSTTSHGIQETQGSNIKETSNVKEGKGKERVTGSDSPTKTTTASGSGFIPSKKDLKGKGKAIARSPSPGLSSTKSNSNKITKSSKNNKENKPFSRRSPSVTGSSEPALNSKSNINNNNIQEEIIVKLDKGKKKAIASPTPIPTPTTTENVDDNDEVIVITTTAASITAKASTTSNVNDKASNSNNGGNTSSASSSSSGPGTIPNKKDRTTTVTTKKDPKEKGKAIATLPSRSPSPGPSSPKTKPNNNNNNTDKANITKVTKRPAAARERQTIKRSLAKKGQHWAFKLESHFARDATDVETKRDKFFILCCPAPNCPSPNFGGKHPFREGRAVAHFAAGGDCLMEIDEVDEDDRDKEVVDKDGDGDVQMTEAEIFERFGAEIVQEQKRWPVDDKWARKNNRELCMKVAAEGEEREGMLRELD